MVAARLASEWCALGAEVTWLAAGTARTQRQTAETAIRKVPLRAWNGIERYFGVPYPIPGISAMTAIWRAVCAADAVVLHDSLYVSNIAAMIVARTAHKPVLIIQHIGAVPYENWVLSRLMAIANRLIASPMLRSASQLVFISELAATHFSSVPLRRTPRILFKAPWPRLCR